MRASLTDGAVKLKSANIALFFVSDYNSPRQVTTIVFAFFKVYNQTAAAIGFNAVVIQKWDHFAYQPTASTSVASPYKKLAE